MDSTENYRSRIFERYNSRSLKGGIGSFDIVAAKRWGKAYDYYFRKWMPEKKDASIIDLACGSGRLLHFFKERGYTNLTGVDISSEQVCLARQVISEVYEYNMLEFLNEIDVEFDLITGLDIIEHLHKSEAIRFLDLGYAKLKPGGRLILSTPNGDSIFSCAVFCGDFTHETLFTPKSLNWLTRLVGFQNGCSRELNPVPYGYSAIATSRFILWSLMRFFMFGWNCIETGSAKSNVYTRNFIFSAVKADQAKKYKNSEF